MFQMNLLKVVEKQPFHMVSVCYTLHIALGTVGRSCFARALCFFNIAD